jgi:hypothetical protein
MLSVISLGTLNSDLMSDLRAHDFTDIWRRALSDASKRNAARNICEWGAIRA